jgi:hypothetical protein
LLQTVLARVKDDTCSVDLDCQDFNEFYLCVEGTCQHKEVFP